VLRWYLGFLNRGTEHCNSVIGPQKQNESFVQRELSNFDMRLPGLVLFYVILLCPVLELSWIYCTQLNSRKARFALNSESTHRNQESVRAPPSWRAPRSFPDRACVEAREVHIFSHQKQAGFGRQTPFPWVPQLTSTSLFLSETSYSTPYLRQVLKAS